MVVRIRWCGVFLSFSLAGEALFLLSNMSTYGETACLQSYLLPPWKNLSKLAAALKLNLPAPSTLLVHHRQRSGK